MQFRFSGVKIDLLNKNSVREFSNGSVAVYVPNNQHNYPETIINVNVTDTPTGIYTLKITPATVENETQNHRYNLLVNTEFVKIHENDSTERSTGKCKWFANVYPIKNNSFYSTPANIFDIWNILKQIKNKSRSNINSFSWSFQNGKEKNTENSHRQTEKKHVFVVSSDENLFRMPIYHI